MGWPTSPIINQRPDLPLSWWPYISSRPVNPTPLSWPKTLLSFFSNQSLLAPPFALRSDLIIYFVPACMPQNRPILEPHQASDNHPSVVEVENIFATLHHSESKWAKPVTYTWFFSSTPYTTTYKHGHFFQRRNFSFLRPGQEDPAELIENLNFAIDGQTYTDENRKLTATRVIFRTHLWDNPLLWYYNLNAETPANWQFLVAAFLSRFCLVPRKELNQTHFLNLLFNFRQRGRSIVEYTREGDQLNAERPEKFCDVLGH